MSDLVSRVGVLDIRTRLGIVTQRTSATPLKFMTYAVLCDFLVGRLASTLVMGKKAILVTKDARKVMQDCIVGLSIDTCVIQQ
jgi:hypothetical protein